MRTLHLDCNRFTDRSKPRQIDRFLVKIILEIHFQIKANREHFLTRSQTKSDFQI